MNVSFYLLFCVQYLSSYLISVFKPCILHLKYQKSRLLFYLLVVTLFYCRFPYQDIDLLMTLLSRDKLELYWTLSVLWCKGILHKKILFSLVFVGVSVYLTKFQLDWSGRVRLCFISNSKSVFILFVRSDYK